MRCGLVGLIGKSGIGCLEVVFLCGTLQVLKALGASGAWGARGNDCGPEPSLRTAPASSSSAFGSLGIPLGLSTPRAPQAPDAPSSGG